MTVAELIAELQKHPPEATAVVPIYDHTGTVQVGYDVPDVSARVVLATGGDGYPPPFVDTHQEPHYPRAGRARVVVVW